MRKLFEYKKNLVNFPITSLLVLVLFACNNGTGNISSDAIQVPVDNLPEPGRNSPKVIDAQPFGSKVFAFFLNTDVKLESVDFSNPSNPEELKVPGYESLETIFKLRDSYSDEKVREYCSNCKILTMHKKGYPQYDEDYRPWGFAMKAKAINKGLISSGFLDMHTGKEINFLAGNFIGEDSYLVTLLLAMDSYSRILYYSSLGWYGKINLHLSYDKQQYSCKNMAFLDTYGGYRPMLYSNMGIGQSWNYLDYKWNADIDRNFPDKKNKITFSCDNNETGMTALFQAAYASFHTTNRGYWLPYIQIEPYMIPVKEDESKNKVKLITRKMLMGDFANMFNQLPLEVKQDLFKKYAPNLNYLLPSKNDILFEGGAVVNSIRDPLELNQADISDVDFQLVSSTTGEEIYASDTILQNNTDVNQPNMKSTAFSYTLSTTTGYSNEFSIEVSSPPITNFAIGGIKAAFKTGWSNSVTNTITYSYPDQTLLIPKHSCVKVIVVANLVSNYGIGYTKTTMLDESDQTTYFKPDFAAIIDKSESGDHKVIIQHNFNKTDVTGVKIPLVAILDNAIKHKVKSLYEISYEKTTEGKYKLLLPNKIITQKVGDTYSKIMTAPIIDGKCDFNSSVIESPVLQKSNILKRELSDQSIVNN